MQGGIITSIGKNVAPPTKDTVVIDAQQRVLTPGLVDLHSHAGMNECLCCAVCLIELIQHDCAATQEYTLGLRCGRLMTATR